MSTAEQLAALLATTGPVLLDFDGPLTPIFAGGLNHAAADHLRDTLSGLDVPIPMHITQTDDPLAVLRYAGLRAEPAVTAKIDDQLRECETTAAATAVPTAGGAAFLAACRDTARTVIIVSNNGAPAIEAYLEIHGLRDQVHTVIGRPYAAPERMKPHPAIVLAALAELAAPANRCVLVGDSVTDIEVARDTGVRSVGYVKRPDRLAGLQLAGADVTTDSMQTLASAVLTAGPAVALPS